MVKFPRWYFAGVMELADVLDSKSSPGDRVRVRPPPPAPNSRNPNQILQIGDWFGFLLFFSYDFFPNGAPVRKESKPRGPRNNKKYDDSS